MEVIRKDYEERDITCLRGKESLELWEMLESFGNFSGNSDLFKSLSERYENAFETFLGNINEMKIKFMKFCFVTRNWRPQRKPYRLTPSFLAKKQISELSRILGSKESSTIP